MTKRINETTSEYLGSLTRCHSNIHIVHICTLYTDKKENEIFPIYKEGTGAKSYMTNGLLIYDEKFAHFLIN